VARLWREHQSGRRDHAPRLWALYCLEMWFRAYCDEGDEAVRSSDPRVAAAPATAASALR
jgi:hypothetical protein